MTTANLRADQHSEDEFNNIKPDKYIFYDEIETFFVHNDKELTMLHVNIVSLITNFDKLKELLCATKNMPDIICLSETRLKKKHTKPQIPQIEGYEFENINSTLSAGGVGIYYRSSLDVKIRHDLNMKQSDCEDLWLQVKIPNLKPIVIAAIYRHPKYDYQNFQYALLHSIEKLNKSNQKYYLLGDFNINVLQYNHSNKIKLYVDLLNCYDCKYILTRPTRINPSKLSRSSLLDHIYTNDCKNSIIPGIIITDTSDHFPITLKVDFRVQTSKSEDKWCRDTKNFSETAYLNDLKRKLGWWIERLTNNPNFNINTTLNLHSKIVNDTVEKHAPYRKMTRSEKKRMNKPWLTRGILISISTRQKYYIDSIKLPILRERYTKYRNLLKHVISCSKRNENRKKILLANNKSKAMWEVINMSLNKNPKGAKPKIKKLKNSSGEFITENKKMANQFNEYFVGIGKNMAQKIPNVENVIHSPRIPNTLVFTNTTSQEVEDIFNGLNPKKMYN